MYTDVGGIKLLYHVCPLVRKIIYSLKLVDYLHVKADNPWYNYYIINKHEDNDSLSNLRVCLHLTISFKGYDENRCNLDVTKIKQEK